MIFDISKNSAFTVCKKALKEFNCDLVKSNYSTGIIEAEKGSSLLSFGSKIIISLKPSGNEKIKISIKSSSLGIQIIDWGTNSENEVRIIDIIANKIR